MIGAKFGRTPTAEITNAGKSKLGRDHNSAGFSTLLVVVGTGRPMSLDLLRPKTQCTSMIYT